MTDVKSQLARSVTHSVQDGKLCLNRIDEHLIDFFGLIGLSQEGIQLLTSFLSFRRPLYRADS